METKGLTVLVQGAPETGKTQVLNWHTQGRPLSSYAATVEDEYPVGEQILGQKRVVTFLDTGGHPDCAVMLTDWVSRAQAQILLINLEDPSSLDYLTRHAEVLGSAKSRLLGGVLVGNLPSGEEANRKVLKHQAQDFAGLLTWAQFSYVETNTRSGENVETAIATLMENVGKTLSGAERAPIHPGPPRGSSSSPVLAGPIPAIDDVRAWARELKISKEAFDIVGELTFGELEALFASEVAVVKIELHEYGVTKASDRNKLIAGWTKRKTLSRNTELDRVAKLEAALEEHKKQLQAATTRIELLEAQLSDASWTHRIQELFLKQLQSIGWTTKGPQPEPKPEVTPLKSKVEDLNSKSEELTPIKSKTEDVTPIKSKAIRGRKLPSRGALFQSPASSPTK